MIRAVVIEDDLLTAQNLAMMLEDTWQVEVIGTATDSVEGLHLCAQLRPDAVFLDVNLSSELSLATGLAGLAQPPRLVFTAVNEEHAAGAFRFGAVDFLLKPLDPSQVGEAVNRLLAHLRPLEFRSLLGIADRRGGMLVPDKMCFAHTAHRLLPVTDIDRDQIRLLTRHEIVAVLRRKRRTWIHTVLEEFPTYYSLTELLDWLGGDPFLEVGRHAVVNLRAVERIIYCGDRLYRLKLRDRVGTEIMTSPGGATRLTAVLKTQNPKLAAHS
jgi:two-component system response regulator LytT